MLHHSGMDQIDIHLCLNIERRVVEYIIKKLYSKKTIHVENESTNIVTADKKT